MSQTETNPALSAPTPSAQPSGLLPVFAGLFRQSRFLLVVLVLCAAAVGLNASVQFLQLHFKKEPVPMRIVLSSADPIPTVLGSWVQVARNETLQADTLHALGTDEFFFCSYVNAAALGISPEEVRRLYVDGKTVDEQKADLSKLQRRNPTAVLSVAMTYYTGKADTVAHIPERCYVGEGFDPENPQTELWGLDRNLSVRHIKFHSTTRLPCDVAYFFHTNGHYESDSLTVRATLQNLLARYGYYAKVELMCTTEDQAASAKAMQDFLSQALPSVERVLPDWAQYEGRK
jgi:hypothetical protein